MALNTSGMVPEIIDRFRIAQDLTPPEDLEERLDVQGAVRDKILEAAEFMAAEIEGSRELSLAFTHLEEALMWAGKAIFRG